MRGAPAIGRTRRTIISGRNSAAAAPEARREVGDLDALARAVVQRVRSTAVFGSYHCSLREVLELEGPGCRSRWGAAGR
jgi:hypothetical protein